MIHGAAVSAFRSTLSISFGRGGKGGKGKEGRSGKYLSGRLGKFRKGDIHEGNIINRMTL